jgi:hypothetical protein
MIFGGEVNRNLNTGMLITVVHTSSYNGRVEYGGFSYTN